MSWSSRPAPLRIAVLGSGANGAGIGADLLRAGLDVTFVEQWPRHVEAVRAAGVTVRMPDRTEVTPVPRVLHLAELAERRPCFDIVLVLVKAYDTRWALELIAPYLAPDGVAVGLQNGMTLDAFVEVVGADRTVGAVIEVTSNLVEPGIVTRQTPPEASWFAVGGLTATAHARATATAAVLGHAGTVEVSDDIRSSKWMKLVVNAAELVPSAILDLPLAEAAALPGMVAFMTATGREAARAAVAAGSALRPILGLAASPGDERPEAFADRLFEVVRREFTLPDTRTTCLQDWQKGRRSEAAQLNGVVARTLHEHGLPAPFNGRVTELALRIESGAHEAGPGNLALLTDLLEDERP